MAETKENKEIKFDFDTTIKRINGDPVFEQDEVTGAPLRDKPFTMRSFIANLLWNTREKEEQNINNAMLAQRIYRAKTPITLKVEERTLIKSLVKKSATPGVFYQVDCFLEGKDAFDEAT